MILWFLLNNILLKVMNAADFIITLEDEGNVIHSLTDELHILTVEIKQELADVEEGVERESSEIRRDMQHVEEEMRKV